MHAQQGSSGLLPVGLPDTPPATNSVSEDTCSAWAILLGHVTALSIFPSFLGMGSFVATSLFRVVGTKALPSLSMPLIIISDSVAIACLSRSAIHTLSIICGASPSKSP